VVRGRNCETLERYFSNFSLAISVTTTTTTTTTTTGKTKSDTTNNEERGCRTKA
jgi:hypothetical protein